MPDLAIIVPTRGRPENIRKVISAWDFTNAWDHADLVLVADQDDPEISGYRALVEEFTNGALDGQTALGLVVVDEWMPMVHKLNAVAREAASGGTVFFPDPYFALGFAGDDHLPQTIGWAHRYLTVLRELGTGMVYGDDGYQGRKLSTEWAVTSDVVRALGRMVPAPVEHMYCDNSMMDLFDAAGALRHLPEVRIEHMHPITGKAETDEQYQRVNHRDQFRKDRTAYEGWKRDRMSADVTAVRELRQGRTEARQEARPVNRAVRHSPSRTTRRGATVSRLPIPKIFKRVRGATPDEIGLALADFASQVPSDQAIVEIGVFQGRTALLMAWGARNGNGAHLWGVDPWDLAGNTYGPPFTDVGSKNWARYHVKALGYASGITLVNDFSAGAADGWSGPPIGLLFIDGDHSYKGARDDVLMWAPNLVPGAVIAVDDYGHPDWPGVKEAVDELVADGYLEPLQIFHDRLAVTKVKIDETSEVPPLHVQDASNPLHPVMAITSEGVSPSPVAPVEDTLEEWEAVAALRESAAQLDSAQSDRLRIRDGEVPGIAAGTPVEDLNTVQLRALARAREIVLGTRKDKRMEMLQALRDGQ